MNFVIFVIFVVFVISRDCSRKGGVGPKAKKMQAEELDLILIFEYVIDLWILSTMACEAQAILKNEDGEWESKPALVYSKAYLHKNTSYISLFTYPYSYFPDKMEKGEKNEDRDGI